MRWTLPAVRDILLLSATVSGIASRNLDVVKTVTLPNGQIIDWIRPESQGEIATPPPGIEESILVTHHFDTNTGGPKGTVPILRSSHGQLPNKKPPSKAPKASSRIYARQNAGQHWYVSTFQEVENTGGSATLSMFEPYLESPGDFSLMQTALIKDGQTLEAGWINAPAHAAKTHLFTFFTSNNYSEMGDNMGGWNTEQKGWIQVHDSIYPGIGLTPYSVIDGEQHEITIGYQLFENNWWLVVNSIFIGYYPGSLFARDRMEPSATLETGANRIDYYGEVFQEEDAFTTTDMGSGEFAEAGYGKAAYFRNLVYTDPSGVDNVFDGSANEIVTAPESYTLDARWNSGTEWGSHFFLGGPGAGGVVGG
ncbi:hypothetical protein QQS21_010991 [Conoideocrella luteorostrata]|uniref:Neprosin PEP catalytic domain-containing protein n=1 Tax=Conoideocrella luteorostrata TaxID=1105319 RepID=A0AAJ0CGM8_9HYPO|nr:hypothetical protein QQS21_010991 [Conoideocrella luteorostrata]